MHSAGKRGRAPLGARAAIATLGTLVAAACANVLGFEELKEAPRDGAVPIAPLPDGTASPPADAGIDVRLIPAIDPICDTLGLPARPKAGSAVAIDGIFLALSRLDIGIRTDGGGYPRTGFNLDRRCTSTIEESACAAGRLSEIEQQNILDPPDSGGLDNLAFGLLRGISTAPGDTFAPESINDHLARGEFGAVLKITNYNGETDDDEVAVDFFPALGVVDANNKWMEPTGAATDRWIADPRYNHIGRSDFRTATAYVSGGRLIAELPEAEINVVLAEKRVVSFHLYGALVTGDLLPTPGAGVGDGGVGYRLENGVLAGRWLTSDFLTSLGVMKDFSDAATCTNAAVFKLVKGPVCVARDLAAAPTLDVTRQDEFKGMKRSPCSAISAGARIEAYPIREPPPTTDASAVKTLDAAICPAGFWDCDRDL